MKNPTKNIFLLSCALALASCSSSNDKTPVDYVNPYMGNISHLLVPTYPTIHLPNSMLRVYPERNDYTSDQIHGLPMIVTSHRGSSAFNFSPVQCNESDLRNVTNFTYDNEIIHPYYYEVTLDENQTKVKFAPSHQSAIYNIEFSKDETSFLVFNSRNGSIAIDGNKVIGSQKLDNNTVVYFCAEMSEKPTKKGILKQGVGIDESQSSASGNQVAAALAFDKKKKDISMKYGISFISADQAEKNLKREIDNYNIDKVAKKGKQIWNDALDDIKVKGTDEDAKIVFYTSLYRCYERPVNITEDKKYFSAFDGMVHENDSIDFYTDDWIWDTYRATHPLRVLIDEKKESDVINSYIRMAEQMDNFWMPTFPEITGDSRRMNSNHAVATVADAYNKGLQSFDLEKAYQACKNAITEKTLAPWSAKPAGWLDRFYKENGYIPALYEGENDTVPEVHSWEKRQPIAVTLGTSYDEWCLGQIAKQLGKNDEADYFFQHAKNYRTVYNEETAFFHPKDAQGNFIMPFDYKFSGGLGARNYYGENNAWIYRWDVPHNIADLIALMGGKEKFNNNLDRTFRESLGKSKFDFYSQLPDQTGNVGQFSMANEPSLHIPYLYNYSGKPWMTQKRIRTLVSEWFRNDLMGVPGDEDGGGMSAFVVFSMAGFYPVTPGLPIYNIGSPVFENMTMTMSNGKKFSIKAENYSPENKYIQAAKLNGKDWNKPWFSHDDIISGGELVVVMGKYPNKNWGNADTDVPPSFNY
ncbi:MAG: GH92 family glycosyl hydrolase [Bacteroidales bacterium]|nr:GH92 family glycosyl hydrolase [Bacteroidales bacterium]